MRAILVAVDYTDLLALTLPYNRHHFESVLVVTDGRSSEGVEKVAKACDAEVFSTEAFYHDGAVFNKWKALEWGLDYMRREGWICLMDADVVWPKDLQFREQYETISWWNPAGGQVFQDLGQLCTPRRRMLEKPSQLATLASEGIPPENLWRRDGLFPLHLQQREFAGYTQIFHALDPVLGPTPWHEVNWRHAGGADSFFQAKWAEHNKVRPPFEVLHLGPAGVNWCGRATERLDGSIPEGAAEKQQQVRRFVRGRTQGPGRFDGEKL